MNGKLQILTLVFLCLVACEKDKVYISPKPIPAPTLTYTTQNIAFSSLTGGVTKEVAGSMILNGVTGEKDGYTIKEITLVSSTASATLSGDKFTLTKVGNIVFNLVLKHSSKQDASIKNCTIVIDKGVAASLTFNKRTKTFASGGRFSTSEILAGVQGTKTGYTLKSIASLTPSDIASVSGTKPNFALNFTKAGNFTATIVLEHTTKADATVIGATFEIVKNSNWDKIFGGSREDVCHSIIQISDGSYALAGYTMSKGGGDTDFWLVKTNASGTKIWDKTFGGGGRDKCYSVIQTSDGGYALAGYTASKGSGNYDFWLVKTDVSGNKTWDKTFGGSAMEIFESVIQTNDGGYVLAGGTHSKGAGSEDFWLVKTDASGNKTWDKTFGRSEHDRCHSVIQTSDGGYALGGASNLKGVRNFWLVKYKP